MKEEVVANTTKFDIVEEISQETGLTQADTKIVVESLLDTISEFVEKGRTIEIRGFGTFYTKERKPRPARNPRTGDVVPLPKRIVPLFKYSNDLKKRISSALQSSDDTDA